MYLTFQEYFEQHERRARALGQAAGRRCSARWMAQMGLGIGVHRRQGLHVRQLRADWTCRPTLGQLRRRPSATPRDVHRPEFKKADSSRCHPAPQLRRTVCPRSAALIAIYKTVEQLIDDGQGAGCLPRRATAAWPRRCSRCASATASGLAAVDDDIDAERRCSSLPTARSCWSWLRCRAPVRSASAVHHRGLHAGIAAGKDRRPGRRCRSCGSRSSSRVSRLPPRPARSSPRWSTTAPPTSACAPLVHRRDARACVIPVFPGTNCEYDTRPRLRAAPAAEPHVLVINNLTARRRGREHARRW